ncbi:MAG: TPM domain-containing protein [Cloacibacterium sp.]|nr:TPM domain-containing protein [Cloacibacterium sp.]
MNRFLTETQMASLVEAIQTAEDHSTGEIRVHIDATTEGNNAQTAFDVFCRLHMYKTKERNAVLFHVNFEQKYLTIIGDEGIHQKVSQKYWDGLHDKMTSMFAQGNYFEGLRDAILETGIELKKYFPISESGNPNELPNEITFS